MCLCGVLRHQLMQSEWQTEIENLEVKLPKNLLFVRLWCDFVVNLRVHC